MGIAEASISLTSMITGDDKRVDALETGLAMQGICQQALTDYKNAVIAVSNGTDSEDAKLPTPDELIAAVKTAA